MAAADKPRRRFGDSFMIVFLILGLFVIPGLLIFMPDDCSVKTARKDWQLEWCGILQRDGREFALAHLSALTPVRAPGYDWLVALDTAGGRLLGEYLDSERLRLLGRRGGRLWLRELHPGALFEDRDFALSLPGLDAIDDPGPAPAGLAPLRFGSVYTPPAPRRLDGEPVLAGRIAGDRRSGRPLDLGGGDRLLVHQSLEGRDGKLILSRLHRGRELWRLTEAAWAGRRGGERPGYRLQWAGRSGAVIVLLLMADEAPAVLAGLDPEQGRLAWRRRSP